MRYHILSNNSSSVLNITQIGFSADTKITRFGPGKRNLYIIHYVTKGKGYYNGNLITAGQGLYLLKNSVCKNKKNKDTSNVLVFYFTEYYLLFVLLPQLAQVPSDILYRQVCGMYNLR